MRLLISVLAICGAVVSALALNVHYSAGSEPCSINEKWDCGVVNHSNFSEIDHVPVAAIGIVGYLLLAWLVGASQRALSFFAATCGCAFSLYLTHIERNVIGMWCLYCVISQVIIALLVLLCLIWMIGSWIMERSDKRKWGVR